MTVRAAADVAATMLLAIAFLVHAAVAAALFLAWRLLRLAERSLGSALGEASQRLEGVRYQVQGVTHAVIAPQVGALSAWAGARAGVRALFRPPR